MEEREIIKYVEDMIVNNLAKRDYWREAMNVKCDETKKCLIAHIDGLIELFTKAKEILENKGGKDE